MHDKHNLGLLKKMLPWILLPIVFSLAWGCSYPGSPAHSTVTFNTESIQTGTVATYRCEPGFDLLGPLRRLCVENGTWIPPGIPVCVLNVAQGKAPMQSSIAGKGVPQKAVDGATSRSYTTDTCTTTETEASPWWYVNLLEPFLVQLVRVDFGRPCCANNRLATVIVRVGNNRPDISANPICNRFTGKIEEGRPLFFPCTNSVSGAFISIHIDSPTPMSLSICETFVYTDRVLPVEQCPTFEDVAAGSTATYNGKCYVFHSSHPRTMESALRYCELQGGSLVHETSPALQGFLSWELYKRHRKDPGTDYWNGAIRPANSKTWTWLDGKEVIMSFWSVPEVGHNCSKFDSTKGWLWSDTSCDKELNFICQHQPVSCGKPDRPANSTVLLRSMDIGSMVEYQCNSGHLLDGPSSRTCLPTGFYSGYPPKCAHIECGYPANIPNGGYTLINGTRMYRSVVEYFCQDGYILVGINRLVCDSDRKWDGPPPRCDPILCHNPPSIVYGNVTLTINSTITGTTADYVCDVGFKLTGEHTIFCDSTGLWTPKPPRCEIDKVKLLNRSDGKPKRNRASIAARLNMGGIIALGIFGGFVFLAVIISIVVIIVRRSSNSRESVGSLSTYESGGSRERLYQQQRQAWQGSHPSASGLPPCPQDLDAPGPRKKAGKAHSDNSRDYPHKHRHHHHQQPSLYRDSDASLETNTSAASWCPKHDKHAMY